MTTARDNLWEANGNLDSVTAPNPTHRAAERASLLENGTIVTEETRDSDGFGAPPEDVDIDQYQEDDDSDSEISFGNADHGVPAEVKLLSFSENDSDSDSEPSDVEDSEEELGAEDSEEEDDDESVDRDSASEYETDEDSVESERSEEDGDLMDESSCGSAPSRINDNCGSPAPRESSPHELFLPRDVSPSIQSLKFEEEEDDESSDEEEDSSHYFHRTYMIGSGRSGRPRMWNGCPCGVSVSSDSGSSSGSSQGSNKRNRKTAKTGVSFSNSVTVYPVFETAAYPPSVVESMYTKREELRVNKQRNKREFAHDLYDWRNAMEEDEMEPNDEGELVHPVHCEESNHPVPSQCRTRKVVQTYSSALGGYTTGAVNGSGVVHRAKRMRMHRA